LNANRRRAFKSLENEAKLIKKYEKSVEGSEKEKWIINQYMGWASWGE
jgi:hypothetical protein